MYTNDRAVSSRASAAFLDSAERDALALVKVHSAAKNPVGNDWQNNYSFDRADWDRWLTEGFNIGVHAGASRLVTFDLDSKHGGIDAVRARLNEWFLAHGVGRLPHHVETPSKGQHIFMRLPAVADSDALTSDTAGRLIGKGIDVLVGNRQSVAPGSQFNGGVYIFNEAPIYAMPQNVFDALAQASVAKAAPTVKVGKYDKEDVGNLVDWLNARDGFASHEDWCSMGMALRLEYGDAGLDIWRRAHDDTVTEGVEVSKWRSFDLEAKSGAITLATFMKRAHGQGWAGTIRRSASSMFGGVAQLANSPSVAPDAAHLMPLPEGVPGPSNPTEENQKLTHIERTDFVAYLPMNQFIYRATGQMWPGASINSTLGSIEIGTHEVKTAKGEIETKPLKIRATDWLNQNCAVASLTWAPGRPQIMKDTIAAESGWIHAPGKATYNQYLPPKIEHWEGDASPWLDHVRKVFPDDVDHIIAWCAHRVQHPEQKINHGLLLGGSQGIGKDTILEPVTHAIGPWNFKEINPDQLLGQFNGFVKCVILRVNEARNLGDQTRVEFYEKTKTLTAAPPAVLHTNEKYLKEHYVPNVCAAVFTTNHMDGLFLPPDDRRFYVAWSNIRKEDFGPGYWSRLYGWFENGGNEIVAGYLASLGLSGFDAKGPPRKTPAWQRMANTSRAPEDAELADTIEKLRNPDAVTIEQVRSRADVALLDYLRDKRNSRSIPRRFEACGYVPTDNPDASDGLFRIGGKRQVVYVKHALPERERIIAAKRLATPNAVTPPPY